MDKKRELFDYQKQGATWLASKKTALLADQQRLGKAVQTIVAADLVGAQTVLVVCRGVARLNWAQEFKAWSKQSWLCTIIYSRRDIGVCAPSGVNPCVYITSYELLDAFLAGCPVKTFDIAVIDEAHYIKSLEAKRTRSVLGKTGIPSRASRVWALTATPSPNGYASELWPMLFVFGATKLSYWDFARRYCIVEENGFGTQITGTNMDPVRLQELQAFMAPKVLRRTAGDVSVQLPKMSFSTVMVPPGKVDLGLTTFWKYVIPRDRTDELNKIIEDELGILNGILDDKSLSGELLETLKASSKSISTLRRYTALQKLEAACELITHELESGAYNKCVIFAHHRDCILGAMQRLHKFYPVSMYGGTSPSRLERNLKNFQNPKHKTRVFIGQISAAGTSISLSAANHIFFLEESFVPGDNMQAAERCGGVNQPNPIFVRTFCLENSVDQRVQDILRNKMHEIAQLYKKPKNDNTLEDLF